MKRTTTTSRLSKLSFLPYVLLSTSAVRAWLPSPTASATTHLPTTKTTSTTRSSTLSSSNTMLHLSTELSDTAPTTLPSVTPFVKPKRVVDMDTTLYVYDHCPFCVRVRVVFGIKNIKHNLHFLANDDVALPTRLVGKKIAPIFEFPEADICMAESMDIIELVDSDERFGPTNMIQPASGRTDLKEWQKSVQSLLRTLQRPRYVATGLLPEFQQKDARHAFIVNHQLPPYDKEEWKSMDKDEKLKIFEDAMSADPAPMIEELNARLVALDDIVYCEHYCTEGGLSLDDIDLWARLRSITIVNGVVWPEGLRKYMDRMSELADVPLYDAMAM